MTGWLAAALFDVCSIEEFHNERSNPLFCYGKLMY